MSIYENQGVGALFIRDDANSKRLLFDSTGSWNLLFFDRVSEADDTMYAEF